MAQLADAIRQVNARELDQNEAALAACFPSPAHELSDEMKALLAPFVAWCEAQRVRALPARPTTVAAYLQAQKYRGVQPFETLLAIEALHILAGMANPVAVPVVRSMIEGESVVPPRSWTRVEKEEFQLLPRHVQEVLVRRENDRERALRRGQNEIAEERKRLQEQMPQTKSADEARKRIEDAEEERLDRETRGLHDRGLGLLLRE
jgi:hypothetical protein